MLAVFLLSLVLATSDFEEENQALRLLNAQLRKTMETAVGGEGMSPESIQEEGLEAAQVGAVPLYELENVEEDRQYHEANHQYDLAEFEDFQTQVGATGTCDGKVNTWVPKWAKTAHDACHKWWIKKWGAKKDCTECRSGEFGDKQCSKVCCEMCSNPNPGCVASGKMCVNHQTLNNVMSGMAGVGGALAIGGGWNPAVGALGGVLSLGALAGNIVTDNMADCSECCSKANYWWGKASMRCGPEPKWKDGSLCGIGTTCKACKNPHTYWFSKAMTACGKEPCWGKGSLCGLGTTCKACCNKPVYWFGKAMTACGQEPCWGKGTWCLHGTSCRRCCNGASWSKCK